MPQVMWLEGLIVLVVILLALVVGCTCMHVSQGVGPGGGGSAAVEHVGAASWLPVRARRAGRLCLSPPCR